MKKSICSILSAFCVLIPVIYMTSCSKTSPPNTCVGSVPDTAYVGQLLNFTSCTNGANSYLWNFGDGGIASTASASHTYTAPGTYQCSLTTSNGQGNTKNFTIIVLRATNLWRFQGATDTSAFATLVGDTIQTTTFSSGNLMSYSNLLFAFSSAPIDSGTYDIINDQFGTPAAHQVAIYLTTPSGNKYGSTGNDHATARVTIYGGKAMISVSSAMMANFTTPSDSSVLSAAIRQTN